MNRAEQMKDAFRRKEMDFDQLRDIAEEEGELYEEDDNVAPYELFDGSVIVFNFAIDEIFAYGSR